MAQQLLSAAGKAAAHLPGSVKKVTDIIPVRGVGTHVYDNAGKRYLDFQSGIGALSTGHSHPRVVSAVQAQAATLVHAQQNCFLAHEPQLQLIDRLLGIVPRGMDSFFFSNSGSEAIDNVIKTARTYTGRPNIIAFEGAFHGRTIGAMSLTSSSMTYRQGFQPLMPGTFHAQYPDCNACFTREVAGDKIGRYPVACTVVGEEKTPAPGEEDALGKRYCCGAPLKHLEKLLDLYTSPSETAAVIVEPILGEGGVLTPPPGFLRELRSFCDKHEILLVFDEIQCGAGRTGKWWGHQHWGEVNPDMLTFAKGIASGYPIAGMATTSKIVSSLPMNALGGTYGGNAVACVAASATIDTIIEEELLQNAQQRGAQLAEGLLRLADRFPIGDLRGRGLMLGCEFTKEAKPGCAAAIVTECVNQGLLLLKAGTRETLRVLPPLTVSEAEAAEALEIMERAMGKVF